MVKLIDLGDVIAKIEDTGPEFVNLCIIAPSDTSGGAFIPADSINIHGIASIKTLQAALNDFFHNREE